MVICSSFLDTFKLNYLEEMEELYTQDAAVFAGRRLHAELEKQEGEEWEDLYLDSKDLSNFGKNHYN